MKNSSLKSDQYYIQVIRKWAEKFQNYNIQMQLEWIPEHMNIKENELADKAAKKNQITKNSYRKIYFYSLY